MFMSDIILKATLRDLEKNNLKENRKNGLIPAVLYGQKAESQNLWVDKKSFAKVFTAAGENTIVELDIEGKKKENVLIYDFQEDVLTDEFMHIDFYRVDMAKKIEAEVPINLIGEAPAVKEKGGVLVGNMDHITVKCFPGDIPHSFDLDVSKLVTFEDHITVADLSVSDKVEIELNPETVIALVTPPRSEEELAGLDEKVEEDVSKVEGTEKEKEVEAPEAVEEEIKK